MLLEITAITCILSRNFLNHLDQERRLKVFSLYVVKSWAVWLNSHRIKCSFSTKAFPAVAQRVDMCMQTMFCKHETVLKTLCEEKRVALNFFNVILFLFLCICMWSTPTFVWLHMCVYISACVYPCLWSQNFRLDASFDHSLYCLLNCCLSLYPDLSYSSRLGSQLALSIPCLNH